MKKEAHLCEKVELLLILNQFQDLHPSKAPIVRKPVWYSQNLDSLLQDHSSIEESYTVRQFSSLKQPIIRRMRQD